MSTDNVDARCCGLSSSEGELVFTSGLDTMNRIALPDEMLPTAIVPVHTLDQVCAGRVPRGIKIDVEGHEPATLEAVAKRPRRRV